LLSNISLVGESRWVLSTEVNGVLVGVLKGSHEFLHSAVELAGANLLAVEKIGNIDTERWGI
jgi:hypothetical protein